MSINDWLVRIDEQVQKEKAEVQGLRWQRQSIYKLPACILNLNKNAYTPQVVSFGPYHCKNENLKPMEEHKDRALIQFLKKTTVLPQQCFDSLKEKVSDLMGAYDSLDADFQKDPDAFLKLMFRDGCFMLEIFRAWGNDFRGYAENDPIFSKHGKLKVMPHIRRDMLLLENQLPMKVLHVLHQPRCGSATENEVNKIVFEFFFPGRGDVPSNRLHILDMYRETLLQFPSGKDPGQKTSCFPCQKTKPDSGDDIIRSAVELEEAGIKIKRSKTRSLRDITFEKGKLSLPMIMVDDITEPLYLNLIAFERFHVGAGNEVTSYVIFMDNIIDDALDVKHLHYKDIIQNGIGSDKAAAKLFNSLTKDVTLDKNSRLGEVYSRVNAYCKKQVHKYRADLCHKYFTSPWAIISVLAAILLFALTITQTVYSVLSYHNQG